MHRVLIDSSPEIGQRLDIAGEEARHAVRVKRLEPGETLELLDGRGLVARATVEPGGRDPGRAGSKAGPKGEWTLTVRVDHVMRHPRTSPQVHILSAAPKGDRLDEMIDGLSQVGAASWSPLECIRAVAEPRPHRLERLERIAREAAKQCGRAWALDLLPAASLPAALARPAPVLMADAAGEPLAPSHLSSAADVTLLIGPEGGWDPREVEQARAAGASLVRFGPHIMRIEQAAIVGAALALHLAPSHPA